jgi:O-antigen biosynthesis protein
MPAFSIVTPVFNPPIWALEACIASVLQQTFTDWEWCIADDASTDPKVHEVLRKLEQKDKRVKVSFRSLNGGIVAASNTALQSAIGEFVALLDHDDSLTNDALEVINSEIQSNENIDYLYSDEDKIDEHGNLFDLFEKPDFSPERLRGQNYCSHLSVFRNELIKEIGGFREGFEGSQDYDLILRATEKARKIVHIAKVLYHWRVIPGSTAMQTDAKPYAFTSAKKAVEEHCSRVGIDADIEINEFGYLQIRRHLKVTPKVSIIMPTRGDRKRVWGVNTCLAANAITSVLQKSTYPDIEIVLVHDTVAKLDTDLEKVLADERVKTVWYSKPFDFSEKCNIGVSAASGELIILLNDDTEVISPDWIEILVGLLSDPNVAVVGPMTVLGDGRIQSAGHGNNPSPHNLGTGEPLSSTGQFGERLITREITGVTGACFAVTKKRYFELGGMSEVFPHSFNDVDFTYKALMLGYRVLWTPLAQIWHFETLSREPNIREEEFDNLHDRWGRYFGNDRFTVNP